MHGPLGGVLIIFFEFLLVVQAGGCHSCDGRAPQTSYRNFSTRTAYDVTRGREVKVEEVAGCQVKQVYLLMRHGTRYPGRDEMENMLAFLPFVRDAIVDKYSSSKKNATSHATCTSHNSVGHCAREAGHVCGDTIENLKKWRMRMRLDDALGVTERGLEEMYHIGQRMRIRFPSIFFKSMENLSRMDLRYSDNYRTAISAKYLAMGFLDHDLQRPWVMPDDVGYAVPHTADRLLLTFDLCHTYIKHRLQQKEMEKVQSTLFDKGPVLNDLLKQLDEDLSLGDHRWNLTLLMTVMEACRFHYAIYEDSVWCNVLPLEAMKVLEYRQDMKYYWRYGPGREVNYQPACILMQDVVSKFRAAADNHKGTHETAVLRLGHSRTILPFLVRLGLFNDSLALLADNYDRHGDRKWQLSRINPFSSNLAIALYECHGEHHIRAFLNERELLLPGCPSSGAFCRLQDLEASWKHFTDPCDFDDICQQDEAFSMYLDLHKDFLHHL